MRAAIARSLALSLFGLSGCGVFAPQPGPDAPSPSAAPPSAGASLSPTLIMTPPLPSTPATPAAPPSLAPGWVPVSAAHSDSGLAVLGGNLTLQVDGPDGKPVVQGSVSVYGPTLAIAPIDGNGNAAISGLAADPNYRLVISAPGFASRTLTLPIQDEMETAETLTLQPGRTVAGRVLTAGNPVVGATVSDGVDSTVTDAQGRYALVGVSTGTANLTASKCRFRLASRSVAATPDLGDTDLALVADPTPSVYIDTRYATGSASFGRLKNALGQQGWAIASAPPAAGDATWVLVSPQTALPADTRAAITQFVTQGGKLIVLGDWGGSGSFDNPDTNTLVHALGLHFNPDLVRQSAATGTNAIAASTNGPLATPRSLTLFGACSVFSLPPLATYMTASASSYHVQDAAETPALAAGGACGAGKVIAIGSAAAWSDQADAGAGSADLQLGDNLAYFLDLLAW